MKTALSIAGSDSCGGAGIQADIKTMTMNGVYAMTAITALTAQNTTGVRAIQEATPAFLKEQLDAVFEDIFPDAVKIGMVSSSDLIRVIAERLRHYGAKNIVVDPVMVATSGSSLMKTDAVQTLIDELLPVALPDAAAHGHDALGQRGAGAQRSILERGHLTVEARVGGFAHAARHEHNEVGILDGIDGQRAQAFEHAGDALGIVFVHLAAERADTEREVRERGMRVHGDPQCAGADGAASASPPAAGMETPRV